MNSKYVGRRRRRQQRRKHKGATDGQTDRQTDRPASKGDNHTCHIARVKKASACVSLVERVVAASSPISVGVQGNQMANASDGPSARASMV